MTNLARNVFWPWENVWYFRFLQNSSSHYFFSCLPNIWKKLTWLQFVKAYDVWMGTSVIFFFMVRSKNIFLMLRSPCAKKFCASENYDASIDHTSDQQN